MTRISAYAAVLLVAGCATTTDPTLDANGASQYATASPISAQPVAPSAPAPLVTSEAPSHYYITGPRGGCYYINSHGNKTYVDHGFCR